MTAKQLTLSELNNTIKETIQEHFFENTWVVAEIGELKYNRNGHAYLELIEKEEDSDKIIAKARATIWSYTLRMLRPYFETTTNQELTSGLKVLVSVSVEFHKIYGFSLNIRDIDPTYTLGDIEKRRLEIIFRLEEEGIIDLNKELDLPLVIQKIAVISSETAAGYEDFLKQLSANPNGYKFYTRLFPAIMQGEQTESSIINALDQIFQHEDFFDVVVIIRGGGARSDLMSFDKYSLAENISQFPLPVISGIGHEKDISIVDLVSHTSVKTPTAVAEFLISQAAEFEAYIDDLLKNISSNALDILTDEQKRIDLIARQFVPNIQNRLFKENNRLSLLKERISNGSKHLIDTTSHNLGKYKSAIENNLRFTIRMRRKNMERFHEKLAFRTKIQLDEQLHKLSYFENSLAHLDPQNVLKKGYSITKLNGKVVTKASKLKQGDKIETILYNGNFVSIIQKTE